MAHFLFFAKSNLAKVVAFTAPLCENREQILAFRQRKEIVHFHYYKLLLFHYYRCAVHFWLLCVNIGILLLRARRQWASAAKRR